MEKSQEEKMEREEEEKERKEANGTNRNGEIEKFGGIAGGGGARQ